MKIYMNRIVALVMLMAFILTAAGCQSNMEHKQHESSPKSSANVEKQAVNGTERAGTEKVEEGGSASISGESSVKDSGAPQTNADKGSSSSGAKGKDSGEGSETAQGGKQTEQPAEGNSSGSKPGDSGNTGALKPSDRPAPSKPAAAKPNSSVSNEQSTVTLSIKGDKKHGTIVSSASIAIEKGDTVLDLLKRVTRKNKIQMEFRGSGATAYVEGIDNLYEFDLGPESGWIYKVNGKPVNDSAGGYEVKKGDVIEWIYSVKQDSDSEDS